MPTPPTFLPTQLRDQLSKLFYQHGLSVGIGLSSAGITIRSQDPRVDAQNIGTVEPYQAATEADSETASHNIPVVEDAGTGFEPRADSEDETSDRRPGPFDSFGGQAV